LPFWFAGAVPAAADAPSVLGVNDAGLVEFAVSLARPAAQRRFGRSLAFKHY
jgi:hypothetical protein